MFWMMFSAAFAQDAAPASAPPPGPATVSVPAMPYPTTQPVAPGSLWVDTQARMLSGLDGNARAVGDLVTVTISDNSRTSISAGTSANSSSDNDAQIRTLFGIGKKVTDANPNMGGAIGMGAGSDYSYNGDGSTSREGEVEATLTCTVQQVLPNGNLFIAGRKEVRISNESQYVTLSGTIRPQDIQSNNMIDSARIADPTIQIHGQGVLADDQRTRIGTRLLKRIFPF